MEEYHLEQDSHVKRLAGSILAAGTEQPVDFRWDARPDLLAYVLRHPGQTINWFSFESIFEARITRRTNSQEAGARENERAKLKLKRNTGKIRKTSTYCREDNEINDNREDNENEKDKLTGGWSTRE